MKNYIYTALLLFLFVSCGESTTFIEEFQSNVRTERDFFRNSELEGVQGGIVVFQLEAKNHPVDSTDVSVANEKGIDFAIYTIKNSGRYHFRINPEANAVFKLINLNNGNSLFEIGNDSYEIEVNINAGKYKFQVESKYTAEESREITTLIIQPDIEKFYQYIEAGTSDILLSNLFYISSNSCIDCDFSRSNLNYMNLSKFNFKNAIFKYASLQKCNLDSSLFTNAEIQSVRFDSSSMKYTDFSNLTNMGLATFDYANLEGANFSNTVLRFPVMYRTNLHKANFEGSEIIRADAQHSKMESIIFKSSKIKESKFTYTLLDSAELRQSNLCTSQFINCTFTGAVIDTSTKCPPQLP